MSNIVIFWQLSSRSGCGNRPVQPLDACVIRRFLHCGFFARGDSFRRLSVAKNAPSPRPSPRGGEGEIGHAVRETNPQRKRGKAERPPPGQGAPAQAPPKAGIAVSEINPTEGRQARTRAARSGRPRGGPRSGIAVSEINSRPYCTLAKRICTSRMDLGGAGICAVKAVRPPAGSNSELTSAAH